ncbi:fungal hydrophobin domain-containing protein [Trichoderma breve]|uniref:Fungal hydrophobin domain-containing protein n=1 Tax=Trichoderma breve TaxID=2034170 RepID=A0A9W9EEB0_9HYPO|nr:fungal hydrophobin domain-containing protein [Trichoderma breve]KAJ4865212.1 fungal hydrophobin domain-containing protein [Trichoderma breve]
MKFFTIVTLLAAVAIASPLEDALNVGSEWWGDHDHNDHDDHIAHICPQGLYSNPYEKFYDSEDLRKTCTKAKESALCCVASVSDEAILCQPPLA